MEEWTATFEIDSKTDAYAVERMMNQMYDTIREESRSLRQGSEDSTDMLTQFRAIREAAHRRSPGTLTVSYEVRDDKFDR